MSPAWMPLYIADYLKDTIHLSAAEHGAYMLLIMRYWQDGGLPADEKMVARYSRLSPAEWAESRDVLISLFGPNWSHPRIDEELAKASGIIDKRRHAAEQMHAKRTAIKDASAPACAEQVQCANSDTRVPYLSPSPREEEQNKAIALSSAKPDLAEAMVAIYHEVGAGIWPLVTKITAARRSSARHRIKDCGGLDGWRKAMIRARDAPHLMGGNDRGWVAGFDFFMQERSFRKLLEGYYDARNSSNPQRQHRPASGHDNILTALDELVGSGHRRDERSADHAGVDDAYRDPAGVYRLTN